jgi:hypothetical protein
MTPPLLVYWTTCAMTGFAAGALMSHGHYALSAIAVVSPTVCYIAGLIRATDRRRTK